MNNILNALQLAEQQLLQSQTYTDDANRDAKLDASILLAHVISKPRAFLLTWPDQVLSIGQAAMFAALIERRAMGEPIAYLTHQKEFFSLIFKINNSVLIPRFETEILVETILEKYKDHEHLYLLELGTGSGVISIALAKCKPNWRITAVDKSEAALEVAKSNAVLHNISNINFVLSDWYTELHHQQFDCIVANPPYIAHDDPNMSSGDVVFEPRSALVAEKAGIADIETIMTQGFFYLKANGVLIFEHGYNQLEVIKSIVSDSADKWDNFYGIKDYSDHDRIFVLHKQA